MPSANMRTTGATPLPSFMLLEGQCATPTPRAFRIAMSASLTQTQCAAMVRPANTPSVSKTLVGVMWRCDSGVVAFLLGLGQVNDQRRVVLVGQGARSLQRCVGIGVERVRGNGRHHQRVVAETREIALGELERVGGGLGVGDGEADDGLAQHAAHAGLFGHFRHHVLEVVHVGEGGGAAKQHFEAAEARAPAHEIGRDVLGFGGEDVFFEPVLEARDRRRCRGTATWRRGCGCR